MSWIKEIDESEATDKLKDIYKDIKQKRGKLSNIMKVQSLNPEAMKHHIDLYITLLFGKSGLSRELRELIALVVSNSNQCFYCINHHAEALNHYWKDKEKINILLQNYKFVRIPEKNKKIIDYVKKLTEKPKEMKKTDIEKLQDIGFTDEEILNINLIACYFNFVNRIVLGLGVEYSREEMKGYKY
jgi:uncharacterized peroxidase-related enzyme